MTVEPTIVERVRLLVEEVVGVEVPDDDMDLMASGFMDSLTLITMISEIEREFKLELALAELDVADFRSVDTMTRFLTEAAIAVS
jgi:acyl carrier protein